MLLLASGVGAQTVLVQPYVQPGDRSTLDGADAASLLWLTDQKLGEFTVEFGVTNLPARFAKPVRVSLDFAPPQPKVVKKATDAANEDEPAKATATKATPEAAQHYFKYTAALTNLPLDSVVTYRVKLGTNLVRESSFHTRANAANPTRFVMTGDLANGKPQQNAVAFQISRAQPQFVVVLGDIVYPIGRVSQYLDHFWSTYNQPTFLGPSNGAPLMASIPFYAAIGNHDVDTHNLVEISDVLGAYHFFRAPPSGPGEGPWSTPIGKSPAATTFRGAVGDSYPNLGFYSFDSGPAHFLMLDTSGYVNLENPKLRAWIERDLRDSRARWKFVCTHNPLFHSARDHYTEQKTRFLAPLLESCGVDLVFSGHIHNYQRSVPLRFTPNPPKRLPGGYVNGDFQLDQAYDGITNTRPNGIIHIVTGGGGGPLYGGDLQKNARYFQTNAPGNWVPFTAKFIADRHSFVVVDLTANLLLLRTIDLKGAEFDRVRITKP